MRRRTLCTSTRVLGRVLTTVAATCVALCLLSTTAHAGGKTDRSVIVFSVTAHTTWGEHLFVTGNTPELGSWNTQKAIPLSAASYPQWTASVDLSSRSPVAFKYLIKSPTGYTTWEYGLDRTLTTPTESVFSTQDTFRRAENTPASGIAPTCISSSSSWRYTFVVNSCGVATPLQVLHESGAASDCRLVEPNLTATFPGHGTRYDYVVAMNHC